MSFDDNPETGYQQLPMEKRSMKSKLLLFSPCRFAAQAWLLGFALLAGAPAGAQNFVKNPDFEEPLGPDNWTIVFTGVVNPTTARWPATCTRSDFFIAGRTRLAHKDTVPGTWDGDDGTGTNYWSKFGLHFCGAHDWLMHAYASQVVTGLTPGMQYAVSAWITQFDPNATVSKVQVYMETLGGLSGTLSKQTPYVVTTVLGSPEAWTRYEVINTASTNGEIEIRLHYNKNGATAAEKWRNLDAFFDHVSLMPVGPSNDMPPYKILALEHTGQDIALTWESVMNNRYRIEASQDVSDPNSWVMLERELNVDPKLFATSTNFSFKTNLSSLFYYDPPGVKVPVYFDPGAPLSFRILSEPFVP